MDTNLKKLPNRITIFRMLLIIVFIPMVLEGKVDERMYLSWFAFGIFVIASISDWLDGYIARKYHIESNFGKVMDPLADKIMVLAALICFVWLQIVPAMMVIIIISREFLISGIRIIEAGENRIIAASAWGKAKTVSEIIAILAILFLIALHNTFLHFKVTLPDIFDFKAEYIMLRAIPYWLMFIATATALISGLEYYFKSKYIFDRDI